MLNIRQFQNGLRIVPRSDGATATTLQGELAVSSADGNLYYNNGTSASALLTTDFPSPNPITNKKLDDTTVFFVDTADNTKEFHFDAAGTTGTKTTLVTSQTVNRTITLPDQTGFLVVSGSSGVITNNKLDEATVWFVDTSDNTKALKFDSSASTTATSTTIKNSQTANRVLTLPDLTDTLVSRTSTDTLTNKTLTSPVINTATADTITGIAGGALVIQSATNQNLTLTAQGTGNASLSGTVVSIQGGTSVIVEDLTFTSSTITGNGATGIVINSPGQNLTLSPGTSSAVLIPTRLEIVGFLSYDSVNDLTTTGANATITAFTNTYVRLTNVSLTSISGIPSGFQGQVLVLSNVTGGSVTINNEDTGVTASNRILTGTNSSITLNNTTTISLIYDTATARWRVSGSVGGPPRVFGSRASPGNVVGATGIVSGSGLMSATEIDQITFVQGSGGAVTVVSSPAIQAGTIIGQRMQIIGRSNTNTVTLTNSSGQLELNGNITLGLSDVLNLLWDGTAWVETSRN